MYVEARFEGQAIRVTTRAVACGLHEVKVETLHPEHKVVSMTLDLDEVRQMRDVLNLHLSMHQPVPGRCAAELRNEMAAGWTDPAAR